jgi:rhodanese-related sulfurtransferase
MTATPPPSATPWPLQMPARDLAAFVQDKAQAHDGPAAAPVPAGAVPVLLDVREAWELQIARFDLPGARSLHIPMGTLPARLQELDRQQPILVLCHHGVRSQQCVAFLQRQGFEAAYNVAGGIDAWSREVDSAVPRY